MAKYGSAKYGLNLYGSAVEHPYAGVAGKVMFAVQVDWDRDQVFGGDMELQTITRLRIERGRKRRLQADGSGQMQPGAEAFEIQIVDTAARYDSFNSSSPVYASMGAPAVLLRVMIVSTTSKAAGEAVFYGTLLSAEHDAKTGISTLRGVGLSMLLEVGAAASLYANCQSFSLGAADSYFVVGSTPFPINYWSGRPGGLTLKEIITIILGKAGWLLGSWFGSAVYNLEQPAYFYLDGSSAWETLKDVADGFCARLFFLRTGRLFAMDRLDPNGYAFALAAPTRAQEAAGLARTSPFESLRNYALVRVRPHSVYPFTSPATTAMYVTAWSNGGPVAVPPLSIVDINIEYPVSLGKPMQGNWVRVNTNAITEVKRHLVNSAADKTGTDMGTSTGTGAGEYSRLVQQIGENSYGLTYVQLGNNQKFCTVRLRNYSPTLTAYFFDLEVQVIGLIETGSEFSMAAISDAASVVLNGERKIVIDSRWIQDSTMARNVGQSYIDALATREQASVVTITYQWSGDLLYANLLLYDLGSHVDFGAAGGASALLNFGIYGRWLIVGQKVEWISADGQDALVELTFEKTPIKNVLVSGSASSSTGANVNTATWAHTVPAGDNRLLVVTVCQRAGSGTSCSGVTYGGVALTNKGGCQQGIGVTYPRISMWYLLAPAAGSANIVVTLGGNDYFEAGAVDFVNVHQTTPLGTLVNAYAAAGPAVVTLTGSTGDLLIDGVAYLNIGANAAAGSGQTQRWSASSDANWKGAGSTAPAPGQVDMRWTLPANGYAACAVAVKTVGG
jgi:hypothetical protein